VSHIKKLIKQHDHYTGAPCAGGTKRPLKCAVLSQHIATDVSGFEGLQDCPSELFPENLMFMTQTICTRLLRGKKMLLV
jgi:hypothetical protein